MDGFGSGQWCLAPRGARAPKPAAQAGKRRLSDLRRGESSFARTLLQGEENIQHYHSS